MTGAEERGDVTVDASMAAMLDALDVDDGAAAELVTPSNGVATNTAPPSIVERVLYEAGRRVHQVTRCVVTLSQFA